MRDDDVAEGQMDKKKERKRHWKGAEKGGGSSWKAVAVSLKGHSHP